MQVDQRGLQIGRTTPGWVSLASLRKLCGFVTVCPLLHTGIRCTAQGELEIILVGLQPKAGW